MNTTPAFLKWFVSANQVCAQIKAVCTKYMPTPDHPHKCYDVGDNMQFIMCGICGNYASFASKYSYDYLPRIVRCGNPDHQHQLDILEYQKKSDEIMSRIREFTKQEKHFELENELFQHRELLEGWSFTMKIYREQKEQYALYLAAEQLAKKNTTNYMSEYYISDLSDDEE